MTTAPDSNHQSDKRATLRPIRIFFWTIGTLIAAFQCLYYSQWVNRDSISYLDMSDAVASHNLTRLINVTWSPLYPLLLGIANAIVHPSIAREFAVAHAVNFVCFLLAFAAFEFLLASLPTETTTPAWALPVIAYSLFLWASLGMLTLIKLTPDMLMSAFLFLAVALLLRLRNNTPRFTTYALFGAVLALGYLAKAIMFPLGVLMLIMTLLFAGPLSRKLKGFAIAAVCFAAIAGPFVVAISHLAHRPTIGEAGTIVHMNYVEHITPYFQGTGGATGTYLHPVTVLLAGNPPVLAFPRPTYATYALWFDPFYWSEGVRPAFNPHRQAALLAGNLRVYLNLIAELCGVLAVILYMLYAIGIAAALQALKRAWPLCVISLAALAAYALVHVETRYIGAFVLLLALGLISNLWIPSKFSPRTLATLTAAIVLNAAIGTAVHTLSDRRLEAPKLKLHDADAATALRQLGLSPGDPVASIEPLKALASGWARLARLSIVAEVPRNHAQDYWKSSPEHQAAALAAFTAAGCKVVVAWIGSQDPRPGWQRLGSSQYAVHRLT